MKISLHKIRLRAGWLLAPLFFVLAEPTLASFALGAALTLVGVAMRAWAAGTIHKNAVLTTGGPYAHTRNPLYLGSFLIGLGLMIAGGSLLFLLLFLGFFVAVYSRTMRAEERFLERTFGERFRHYARMVPLFLPRLRPYRPEQPHETSFDMERYLANREWELVLGVIGAFFVLLLDLAI